MSPNNLTSFARHLRRNGTVAEQILWGELRARRLDGCKFRRQAKLSGYIVDFFCPEAKLTIELGSGLID